MPDIRLLLDWKTARSSGDPDLLEQELRAERASALGAAGRKLERALAALNAAADDASRAQRLTEAARVAWEFMVLRESSGLCDWPRVVQVYAIPPEVQRRMGVAPADPPADPTTGRAS